MEQGRWDWTLNESTVVDQREQFSTKNYKKKSRMELDLELYFLSIHWAYFNGPSIHLTTNTHNTHTVRNSNTVYPRTIWRRFDHNHSKTVPPALEKMVQDRIHVVFRYGCYDVDFFEFVWVYHQYNQSLWNICTINIL
mgnify:CR=1 FL=1